MAVKQRFFLSLFLLLAFCFGGFALDSVEFSGEIQYPPSYAFENIAVDIVGRIYLSEKGRKTLQVYNKFGSLIDTVVLEGEHFFTTGGDFIVDKQGNIFVVDCSASYFAKFVNNGKVLFNLEQKNLGEEALRAPLGIAIGIKPHIYIADTGNKRIQIFNNDGIFLGSIRSGDKWGAKTENFRLLRYERFTGQAIPKAPMLKGPVSVSVNEEGYVFVLDSLARFIFIYNQTGEYMGNIDLNSQKGIQDIHPLSICTGQKRVFVLDSKNHNIKVFNIQGDFLQEIGTKGTGRGQFYIPKDFYLHENRLYVLDAGNNRIQIFKYGDSVLRQKQIEASKVIKKPKLIIFPFFVKKEQQGEGAQSIAVAFNEALRKSEQFETFFLTNFKETEINESVLLKNGKENGGDLALGGNICLGDKEIEVDLLFYDIGSGAVIFSSIKKINKDERLTNVFSNLIVDMERFYINRIGAPSIPSGLISIPSVKSIYLRWNPNPEEDVLGYHIFQSSERNSGFKKIADSFKNEYEVLDLKQNVTHFFRVTAYDSEGKESEPSFVLETATRKIPDFGYLLKVKSQVLPKKVAFSWDNPENETIKEYQIYRCESRDGEYRYITSTKNRSFDESGLGDGKEYYYRIRKVYPDGILSGFSNAFVCKTDALPHPVSKVEAVSNLCRQIELRWKSHFLDEDLSEFIIFRAESSGGDFQKIAEITAKHSKYTDRGLGDNKTYYYKLKARDIHDLESEFSQQFFATTRDIPRTPEQVLAESNLPRKIRIFWEFPDHEFQDITFLVFRSEHLNGPFKEIAKTRSTEWINDRLPDSTQYFYFISAKDSDGLVSKPSEIVQAVTKTLPSSPNGVKTICLQPRKVTIVWDKNPEPDVIGYHIFRSNRLRGWFKKIGKTEKTLFVDDEQGRGLKDNENYFYKVSAYDLDGLESGFSEIVQGTTKALPEPPKDVVMEFKNNSVILSWPPVSGDDIFGYVIYKNRKKIEIVKTNLFVDNNVLPDLKYYYEISTLDLDKLESHKSKKVSLRIPRN